MDEIKVSEDGKFVELEFPDGRVRRMLPAEAEHFAQRLLLMAAGGYDLNIELEQRDDGLWYVKIIEPTLPENQK